MKKKNGERKIIITRASYIINNIFLRYPFGVLEIVKYTQLKM